MSGLEARARIRALLAVEPNLTQADLARRAGVSKQRVGQIVKGEGLQAARYQLPLNLAAERLPPAPPRIMVETSADAKPPLNHTVAGTIAEMVAAADLLARGWQVFIPLVRTSKCDLLATDKSGERVIRVEVRAGRRLNGSVKFMKKAAAACDHYAIVLPGEPVIYKPDL